MSMINREVSDFFVHAYQNGKFKTVTRDDILGGWSVFFFIRQILHLSARRSCQICRINMRILRLPAVRFIPYQQIRILCIRHGMIHRKRLERSHFRCWQIQIMNYVEDFEVMIESDGMAERGSFIINPEGRIVSYEVSAGNVGRNADELFRKLQACQFVAEHGDEVCPAKWQPGEATLRPSLDLVGRL